MDRKYREKGLVIIAFPCNQFGGQEPLSEDKIEEWTREEFGRDFMLTRKIDVNGEDADPLWVYLKDEHPGFLGTKDIKWNFTKFLIGRDGRVLHRYSPATLPSKIESDSIFEEAMERF